MYTKSKSLFLCCVIALSCLAAHATGSPAITSFSPSQGAVGTLLTINGANLSPLTALTIGGAPAVVVSNSGTQIVALVMPGAVSGNISLTTSGGPAVSASKFTVTATPNPTNTPNATLTDPNPVSGSQFSYSVAISADGNTVLVGESNVKPNGQADVFVRSNGAWTEQAVLIGTGTGTSTGGSAEGFSVALSADGNTAMIGGIADGSDAFTQSAGAVWFFTRTGTVWTQQGSKLVGTGATTGFVDQGFSVALSADGNTAVESGPYDNNDVGAFWIFKRTNGVWAQQGNKFTASDETGAGQFGKSLSISADGTTIAAGGPADNNGNGACWIFAISKGIYAQEGPKLVGSATSSVSFQGANQGQSCAISADGNNVIFSGPGGNGAWVFTRSGGSWSQFGEPFNFAGAGTAWYIYGSAVAISADGSTALVGCDGVNNNTGASWVFTRTTTGYVQSANAIIGATSGSYSDGGGPLQGYSVALTPNATTAIIGSPGDLTGLGAAFVVSATLPTAVTQAATAVTGTTATLNGTVNDGGASTTVQFLFGTDPNLTGATSLNVTTGTSPIAAGTGTVAFTEALTGLTPNTTYYYEITGTNSTSTVGGGILSFTTASLPVAVITFTAPASATYGAADLTPNGTSTNTVTPIVYSSSNSSVATITATGNIHIVGAGNTQITASQAAGNGYTAATPVSIGFTVKPATLTITAGDTTITYGSNNPNLASFVTYSGFVNGDTPASMTSLPYAYAYAGPGTYVGNYPIYIQSAADPNYTIVYVKGTVTIVQAPLTITANNQTKVAGQYNPPLTYTISGFKAEDSQSVLISQPTVSTTATISSPAGNYPIVPSGASATNYYMVYVDGTLTVISPFSFSPLPTKIYGDGDFAPGATGTNVTYSSGTTSVATITEGGQIHITGAGNSVITASSGENSVQQTLTVNPAPLTITAVNQTRPYNATNPTLTVNYKGFVYSDNVSSLTTAPTVSTTAISTSAVGLYPITVSGAVDPNYTITYVGGVLQVTRASQTIDFATIPNQLVNDKYDLNGVSANSGLPVSFKLSDAGIANISGTTLTSLQVGTETVTASQAGNSNYLPAVEVERSYSIQDDNGNDVVVNQVVSPNGDGIDDVLNIKGIENYPENKLILVNRNGVMIFEMTNYNNTSRVFDGHSSVTGILQQQGTLLYILEYKVRGELKRKTGFTVLRY